MSSEDLPKLRHALGLKQSQLAALLNVDAMTVSRWERRALSPRPWHCELLAVFKRAAHASFTWSRNYGHRYYARNDSASDCAFELPKIPDRLREILNAAFLADHKATEKGKA